MPKQSALKASAFTAGTRLLISAETLIYKIDYIGFNMQLQIGWTD
jgi:hypothetical protein